MFFLETIVRHSSIPWNDLLCISLSNGDTESEIIIG